MNIKKNSLWMLALVFGVSVILYIFDVPIIPTSSQMVPTVSIPTIMIPTPLVVTSVTVGPTPQVSSLRSFSESVGYYPEGQKETLSVSVKLTGTIITELILQNSMNDGKSRRYQLAFESEIQQLVVGRDIRSLNLSKVAGASFTTDAFMEATRSIVNKI